MLPTTAAASFTFKEIDTVYREKDGSVARIAGSHPFAWVTTYEGETAIEGGMEVPTQALKDLRIQLPTGLVGNPTQLPHCPRPAFLLGSCPESTEIGSMTLDFLLEERVQETYPLVSLEPRAGSAAEFGLMIEPLRSPVLVSVAIDPNPPYNMYAELTEGPQVVLAYGLTLTIRGTVGDDAFLTLPRSCRDPLTTVLEASSWDEPDETTVLPIEAMEPAEPSQPLRLSGCSDLGFSPTVEVEPTTEAAADGSGLDLDLEAPDEGLLAAAGRAQADVTKVRVELPPGMAVNPSFAEGLAACAPPQYEEEATDSPEAAGCPSASKIGTAVLETPLLDESLQGSVFLAQPDDPETAAAGAENPFDSLLALYLVFEDPLRGIAFRFPLEANADPSTGQLTATIEGLPPVPVSHLELHLRGGDRNPFVTPVGCRRHPVRTELFPSTGASPLLREGGSTLNRNCGAPEFEPRLSAGVVNPQAGTSSPLVIDLARRDGEQNPLEAALTLPPGLVARFAEVPACPDRVATAGHCPASARVGFARVAAGAGRVAAWIPSPARKPGQVYLAGPYRGAPFSLAIVVPADAGPFHLGTVALRAPIEIDPDTGQARVRVGPLPQILDGIPIPYRTLRMVLDRPGFMRSPTNCAESAVQAEVRSRAGGYAVVSDRFQVGNCRALRFRPTASARLLGPTDRSAHPRLRMVLRSRDGEANVRSASFALPPTQLLDVRRLRNVCERIDFLADRCPPDSAYGYAKAWTPLLDRPLEGPVYLRGGDGRLPDVAASLHGEISLRLGGRLDASRGRLRVSFEDLPDVPLSKVVVTLGGGRRGVLVNAGRFCRQPRRVVAELTGHNGKPLTLRPRLRSRCR